jgi:hypothetical protein
MGALGAGRDKGKQKKPTAVNSPTEAILREYFKMRIRNTFS